jgi:type IV pilus assembly protein PilY1
MTAINGIESPKRQARSPRVRILSLSAAIGMAALLSLPAAAQTISQNPLQAGGNVPGNLLLTPSVEFPTMDSVANLGSYDVNRTYVGYFDPDKCYEYSRDTVNTDERDSRFIPRSTTTTRTCTSRWSGNFMNWATTQTIDPFRKALTGGYRVTDTTTLTVLEKARSDSNSSNSYFPNRSISGNTTLVQGATPATWGGNFNLRVSRLGNEMVFTNGGTLGDAGSNFTGTTTNYQGTGTVTSLAGAADNNLYRVIVRVEVCNTSFVEPNCKRYGSNYKPEGLIQQYSDRIRFSAFGYLNDDSVSRDGAVLRARQKYVGPTRLDSSNSWVANAAAEWDSTTGVMAINPDSADATATGTVVGITIPNSGVMNYINKFGEGPALASTKTTGKSYDPVSELYYTAVRYLKNLGNVPEYTDLTGSDQNKYNQADGFPVITSWDDPIQYACQNNAILGIGDVYTHRDKNLPGSGTSGADEPTKPDNVTADTTINVRTATDKVFALEGLSIDTSASSWSGRNNSAFIAGLAYDSHTKDMRTDLTGKQTTSTFWVDVRENQTLEGRARNQYWLATKYGGFDVPDDFGDPYARSTALPTGWWGSGETLATGDIRPDNFYVASEADKMVESLRRAFAKIAAESSGSASSLASNSTRLDTTTRTFQAQFFTGSWRGELTSYDILDDGTLSTTALWRASEQLITATAGTAWQTRNVKVNAGGSLVAFTHANLTVAQQAALTVNMVDYLRGDRSKEESQTAGTLRTRVRVLGDIVNSAPLFVGKPNPNLYRTATFTGASTYNSFATNATILARTPIVYVGANDGMLHAFNADTGAEVFAFVPSVAISNGLAQYTSPSYVHKYFVDGEITVSDIYDTASSSWKTVLVGTMGRGGPGVFALDVTNPTSPALLWEMNASTITGLGRNIGRPVIAQVANGDWRVIFGNGPDSTGGTSQLIQIRVGSSSNGTVTATAASATTDSGLTAVLARDSNADGFADTAYAGDLQGYVWKFTGLSGTPVVLQLFRALDPANAAQPITAAPLVGRDPATGQIWVFVGTGKYLIEADLANNQVQTWYGLKDGVATITGRAALVSRAILAEGTVGSVAARVIASGTAADLVGMSGWYIDLISPVSGAVGERMVVPNRFQGEGLIGTTRIPRPGNPCSPAGSGWVMSISPFTGGRLPLTYFDVNGDDSFNESDMLCVSGTCYHVSGIGFPDSMPNNPIFIGDEMYLTLDNGDTPQFGVQGSSVQATRMSWRELFQ